jgi:hypothetical protein
LDIEDVKVVVLPAVKEGVLVPTLIEVHVKVPNPEIVPALF